MAKSDFDKLYKEFVSKAKQANRNIKKITETFGKDSWAVKKLKWRLENPKYNGWTKKGRISTSKPTSMEELRARLSAVEKFNKSKTHTVRGINKVRKQMKETIKEKLKNKDFEPSEEEIETLYDAFNDEDIQYLFDKGIVASEFWYEIQDTREKRDSWEEFFKRFTKHYFEENTIDDDLYERLIRIYEKYIEANEKY